MRRGAAALLAATLGVTALAPRSRAQPRETLTLEVNVPSCGGTPLADAALRAKLALFLRADGVELSTVGQAGSLSATLRGACDERGPSAPSLTLVSPGGVRVDRRIDLSDVRAEDRAAVIALAVAETVRGLRAMSAPPTAPPAASTSAAPVATDAPVARPPAVEAPEAPAPVLRRGGGPEAPRGEAAAAKGRTRLGMAAGGDALQFGSAPLLYGLRVEAVYGALRFGVGALTGSARDALGEVGFTLLRASGFGRALGWSGRSMELGVGPFVHLGRVSAHASAGDGAVAVDAARLFLAGGAGAVAAYAPLAELRLGAALETGWARGLVAYAEARPVARLDGPYVAATLFVEARP